jgi:hypothetical protein
MLFRTESHCVYRRARPQTGTGGLLGTIQAIGEHPEPPHQGYRSAPGIGEVDRAIDTQFGRGAALEALPPSAACKFERLARGKTLCQCPYSADGFTMPTETPGGAMRADRVEASWDAGKSKWLLRIQSGEEVIRRYCKVSKDADEQSVRASAEKTTKEEGYEVDPANIIVRREQTAAKR